MVLDELLCRLDSQPIGVDLNGTSVGALAYADDLLLLTPSSREMQLVVDICVRFFEARHMELNPNKCSSLTVRLLPALKKLYLAQHANIFVRGVPFPNVAAEANFKYLGHRYGFMGTDPPSPEQLQAALNNLRRAPLKPHQKLLLLQDYVLPKFLYAFQNCSINLSILDRADKALRRMVKEALHLPLQTANALLYSRRRDGGLGLMCLSARIPDILLGRINRLTTLDDPHIRAALGTDYVTNVRSRLGRLVRPFGSGEQQFTFWRHRLSNATSGAGLPGHCSHPATHRWLRDPPPSWTGGDYVLAAQLRTNTLPTIGGLHNVRLPFNAKRCRGGCQRVETLSHVLQRCPATHHPRIARHDHAVRSLATACRTRGYHTEVEPSIRDLDGRLHRPDLIVQTDRIFVIDVGVNWETPRPLSDHYHNKVAIYSTPSFLEALRRRYPGLPIHVGAIIIGARGTWCGLNDAIFKLLRLPSGVALSLVSGVLHGGVLIHRAFSAAVWAP